MKLVAALAWYMEPAAFLDRLVRSLAGHVDELVALDGAWYGFGPARPSSGRQQRDTIRVAAAEVDLPVRVIVPSQVWASQIEKRQTLFDLAIREQKADWVMVVDGDFTVARCDDDALRRSLELTGLDVATVTVRTLNKPWPLSELPVMENAERFIYRGSRGLTVEHLHYGIRIGSRWVNGDRAYVNLEPSLDLSGVVGFEHDNANRGAERVAAARAYRKTRIAEKLEQWQEETA